MAGLRLTAESLAGRRNRISTVTVERVGQAEVAAVRPPRESRPAANGPAARTGEAGPAAGADRSAGQDGAADQRQASNGLAKTEVPPD
jgi:hypothetical protein